VGRRGVPLSELVRRAASSTTGNTCFAVRLGRTAKAKKRTAKALPCVFCGGARQRAHGSFLHGKFPLSCAFFYNAR
jgi:hypothetical protein